MIFGSVETNIESEEQLVDLLARMSLWMAKTLEPEKYKYYKLKSARLIKDEVDDESKNVHQSAHEQTG